MKCSSVHCRPSLNGGFVLSKVVLCLLAALALLWAVPVTLFESKQTTEIRRLVKEYEDIRDKSLLDLLLGKQTAVTVLNDNRRQEDILRALKKAVEATPPELVPDDTWKLVGLPTK